MFYSESSLRAEMEAGIHAARVAGELVLDLRPRIVRQTKVDGSIVTNADLASASLIRDHLGSLFPEDAILTEEDNDDRSRLLKHRCWLVDPIDGTTAFASGSDDFDIYIALVEQGVPIVAVTHQPATGLTIAAARSTGVWIARADDWQAVPAFTAAESPVVVSRHWLGAPANLDRVRAAAERVGGRAVRATTGISARTLLFSDVDAIIGLSVTEKPISAKEWDVAPLDLFAREAGGWSSDATGRRLVFNKREPNFPSGLILARSERLGREIARAL